MFEIFDILKTWKNGKANRRVAWGTKRYDPDGPDYVLVVTVMRKRWFKDWESRSFTGETMRDAELQAALFVAVAGW